MKDIPFISFRMGQPLGGNYTLHFLHTPCPLGQFDMVRSSTDEFDMNVPVMVDMTNRRMTKRLGYPTNR
jgi:hypothetical protein